MIPGSVFVGVFVAEAVEAVGVAGFVAWCVAGMGFWYLARGFFGRPSHTHGAASMGRAVPVARLGSGAAAQLARDRRATDPDRLAAVEALQDEFGFELVEVAQLTLPEDAPALDLRAVVVDLQGRSRTRPSSASAAAATRRRNAQHEAAHAVLVHAYGGVIRTATANPNGDLSGHVRSTSVGMGTDPVEVAWGALVSNVAGIGWDSHLEERPEYGTAQNDMGYAAANIGQLLVWGQRPAEYTGVWTFEGLMAGATVRAQVVLDANRALVEAIAERLHDEYSRPLVDRDFADLWDLYVDTPVEGLE
jgi:hypothetical protein